MRWFKKITCDHEYTKHSWSYIKCKKCGNVDYNPEEAMKLMIKFTSDMKKTPAGHTYGCMDEAIRINCRILNNK